VLQNLVSNKGSPVGRPLQCGSDAGEGGRDCRVCTGSETRGELTTAHTVQMSILFHHLSFLLGYGIISHDDNLWGVKDCCAESTFLHQHHH